MKNSTEQIIRDRVLFGPGVTIGVSLLLVALGVALLVHTSPDSVEILFSVPELWVLPLLLILAIGTRFGSQKLCRIEIGEKEIIGRRFCGRRAYINWNDVTGVVVTENRIELTTPFSYTEITRSFGRFDEITDFVLQQCARRRIKCKDEPEQLR
jgi:hypothetical protein